MKTLIIVDPQYDFIEGGALPVDGGETAIANIASFIKNNNIDNVYITLDWHPFNHCSFKEYGGLWNPHCLQHSDGAAIVYPILEQLMKKRMIPRFITKGMSKYTEEYTAFTNLGLDSYLGESNWEIEIPDERYNLLIPVDEEVIICGLAGDYCVLESIKALIDLKPKVFLDGIASIDGGEKLYKYITNNNLQVI